MINILLIDDKSDVVEKWAIKLAKELGNNYKITLISDRLNQKNINNFRIFNINDIKLKYSIEELQNKYNFSIYKILVTDRAITNYTNFSKIQMYSHYNEQFLNIELQKWLNAYDILLKNEIDFVCTGSADNFKFNMAWKIAEFYHKKFFIFYSLYWWKDGLLVADRYDQTVSKIDNLYLKYYKNYNFDKTEKERLRKIYSNKVLKYNFTDNNIYPLKKRLKIVLNRRGTYEQISIKNLLLRKFYYYYSRIIKEMFINKYYYKFDKIEQYVIYPMHVAPEASILGSSPELADQICLIKNISMNLPYGVKLYVKEHPSQVYGYNLNHNFYNKLLSLRNVRIIKANENIYEMISNNNCLGVAVLNGTLGLETVFKFSKPVFVFGNADYKIADCFIKPKNWDEFFNEIQNIQKGNWKFDEQAMWAILKAFDESVIKVDGLDFSKFDKWEDYAMEVRPIVKIIKNLH